MCIIRVVHVCTQLSRVLGHLTPPFRYGLRIQETATARTFLISTARHNAHCKHFGS